MRYQDRIEIEVISGGGTADGNAIAAVMSWDDLQGCRVELNTKARAYFSVDGKRFLYNYLVYLAVPDVYPVLGQRVRISKSDGSIVDQICKVVGFVTSRKSAKIWL